MGEKLDEEGQIKPFVIDFIPKAQKKESNDFQKGDLVMIIESTKDITTGGRLGGYKVITHCYLGEVNSYTEDLLNEIYSLHLGPTLEFKESSSISEDDFSREWDYLKAKTDEAMENMGKSPETYDVSFSSAGAG
ncbi:hypothetical protein GF374_02885 [Candidatus Woesearchaeota archaeon]|nr:hypothetical protein [Candidatus Woesearchaeota archaeon]